MKAITRSGGRVIKQQYGYIFSMLSNRQAQQRLCPAVPLFILVVPLLVIVAGSI